MHAVIAEFPEIVQYLLDCEADPFVKKDDNGKTLIDIFEDLSKIYPKNAKMRKMVGEKMRPQISNALLSPDIIPTIPKEIGILIAEFVY